MDSEVGHDDVPIYPRVSIVSICQHLTIFQLCFKISISNFKFVSETHNVIGCQHRFRSVANLGS